MRRLGCGGGGWRDRPVGGRSQHFLAKARRLFYLCSHALVEIIRCPIPSNPRRPLSFAVVSGPNLQPVKRVVTLRQLKARSRLARARKRRCKRLKSLDSRPKMAPLFSLFLPGMTRGPQETAA
jgi:hypothetical protein